MTTATVTPSRSRSPARSAAALPSGSTGSSASSARPTLDPSTPGGGLNQPEPVLGDQGPALARQHPHRLVVDQLAAQLVALLGVLGRRHQPALAFGHHLAGDHHDVAVAQPGRGGGDGSTQIVAGPEFGKPGDGQDLDRRGGAVLSHGAHAATPASSSPALTISAVAFGSLINSGIERTATPSMSAWSPSCTSQQSSIPVPRRAP